MSSSKWYESSFANVKYTQTATFVHFNTNLWQHGCHYESLQKLHTVNVANMTAALKVNINATKTLICIIEPVSRGLDRKLLRWSRVGDDYPVVQRAQNEVWKLATHATHNNKSDLSSAHPLPTLSIAIPCLCTISFLPCPWSSVSPPSPRKNPGPASCSV